VKLYACMQLKPKRVRVRATATSSRRSRWRPWLKAGSPLRVRKAFKCGSIIAREWDCGGAEREEG